MTVTRCTRGLWAGSIALALWAGVAHLGVWVNVSPSLPIGIYRTVDGPVGRGRIVLVCLPAAIGRVALERGYLGAGSCPGGVGRLGKIVAGVAGDTVDVLAGGVSINGRLIAGSAPRSRDHSGRALSHVGPGPWVVPSGMIFLLATRHPLSFDSRYFGAVPLAGVVTCLRRVWDYSD
jgi:conjugative transfer signal peptidase TraF